MTERKPPGMNFTSWIDKQISEAMERGEFDNLPGVGKPLPKRDDTDGQAWLRDYLRREGVSVEEMLPPPLKLRKESSRLAETVQDLRTEQEVRDVVADLNKRIMEWRRIPVGPPIFVPLVDEEAMVGRWRQAQAAQAAPAPAAEAQARDEAPVSRPIRSRWWRRSGRSGDSAGRE